MNPMDLNRTFSTSNGLDIQWRVCDRCCNSYNPEVLTLFGNVVMVTINCHIGMFGFLRDKNVNFQGNQGLWDQHLAIKWVHNNINSFFGYKDEITIFGESAGGSSVLYQAMYA